MSRPIDEKIAKLSMDNSDFVNKAQKSIGIFAKLEQTFKKVKPIDMSKSVDQMNKLNGVADRTTLSKLISGITSATSRFTTLGVIGTTALTNITNKAVNAGMKLGKALTVKPLMDGFNEYELKMKSIQTILSNTQGKSSMKEITSTLDELNTYADKTIYNFADMTRNIGTFTAAGVGLKDSATAIKGISNLAAASGSDAQQASTAMYQLSQALANGKVNLLDWNSVVQAGMGGKLFQDALRDTAEAMGKNIDRSQSFRESLHDGWLTTEVLIETLDKFSKDESMLDAATKVRTFTQLVTTAAEALGSGWGKTWELIFGDFEEAGKMWTGANNVISGAIDSSADARNKLAQSFADIGGRQVLIDSVANAFKALSKVLNVAKSSFKAVFPPATAESLLKFAKSIRDLTKNMIMSDSTAKKLGRVFEGMFSIVSIGIKVVKMIAKAIVDMIPKGIGGNVLDLAARIGDLITGFNKGLTSSGKFGKGLTTLSGIIKGIIKIIGQAVKAASEFGSVLWNGVGKVVDKIGPTINRAVGFITKLVKSLDIKDVMNAGFIASVVYGMKKFGGLTKTIGKFADGFGGLMGTAKDAIKNLGGLTDVLSSMTTAVKATTLMQIGLALGILALAIKLIASVKGEDIAKSLEVLGLALLGLTITMKAITKLDLSGKNSMKAALLITALSISILVLAGGLKILSTIDMPGMVTALLGLAGAIGGIVGAMTIMSKHGGKIKSNSLAMITLAISVVILASAMKIMSKIKFTSLAKAVGAMGVIFAELAIFLKVVDETKLDMSSGIAVIAIAVAIQIMVNAISKIADMDWETIKKGLITIGLILSELTIFANVVDGSKAMSASASMILVAIAMNMLVPPIKKLGEMNPWTLTQGLIGLGAALGGITIALKFAKGSLPAAVSIAIMAMAVSLLVPPIKALGAMSWGSLIKGLVGLAGGLGIIAGAAYLMQGASIGLLAFAAAMGAMGLVFLGIGLAFAGFAAALTVLAGLTVAGIATIIQSLDLLLSGLMSLIPKMVMFGLVFVVSMAKGLAIAAPQLARSGMELILGLLTAMRDYVPQIVEVGMQLLTELINTLADNIGPLIDAGANLIIELIDGMANSIRDNQERMVSAMMNMMGAILEAMVTGLVALVDVLFGWIPGFSAMTGDLGDKAKKSLRENFAPGDVSNIGDEAAKGFVDGVDGKKDSAKKAGENVGKNAKAGAGSVSINAEGKNAGDGYTQGVNSKTGNAKGAGNNVGNAAKGGAGSVGLNNEGSTAGQSYVSGVSNKYGSANSAGSGLGRSAKSGSSVSLHNEGSNAGGSFSDGIGSMVESAREAASRLASAAKDKVKSILGIASPSKVMTQFGGWTAEGFAIGIGRGTDMAVKSAGNMATKTMGAVEGFREDFMRIMDDNFNISPVITPILDTSKMKDYVLPRAVAFAGGNNPSGNNVFNVTINATTNNPRAIAKEVEKIIVRGIQS